MPSLLITALATRCGPESVSLKAGDNCLPPSPRSLARAVREPNKDLITLALSALGSIGPEAGCVPELIAIASTNKDNDRATKASAGAASLENRPKCLPPCHADGGNCDRSIRCFIVLVTAWRYWAGAEVAVPARRRLH